MSDPINAYRSSEATYSNRDIRERENRERQSVNREAAYSRDGRETRGEFRETRDSARVEGTERQSERWAGTSPRRSSKREYEDEDDWCKKLLYGALILLGLLIALYLFSGVFKALGGIFKPLGHLFGKVGKKNCDEEIKALTDITRFDSNTVKSVNLNIPGEGSIATSNKVWVDPYYNWSQDEFNRHIDSILRENFNLARSGRVRDRLDFGELGEGRDSSKFIRIRESNFFKTLLEKLMDFASSRYALSNINFKSEEFSNQYQSHLADFRACSSRIDDLKNKISDLLGTNRNSQTEIDLLLGKIRDIEIELKNKDDQINRNNRDLNAELDGIDIKIREYNKIRADRERQEGDRASKESYLLTLRGKLPKLEDDISRLKATNLRITSEMGDHPRSSKGLNEEKERLRAREKILKKELDLIVSNEDLYQIVTGLGTCEEKKINAILEKLKSKEEEQARLKDILDPNDKLVEELDSDNLKVQEIVASHRELKRKAKEFKLRSFRIKIETINKELREIQTRIGQIDSELLKMKDEQSRISILIQSTASDIAQKTADLDRLNREISDLTEVIRKISYISPSTPDIDDLTRRRKEIEIRISNNNGSILDDKNRLLRLKDSYNDEISQIKIRASNFNTNYAALINELNNEMNNCKRKERLIERFLEEYATVNDTIKDDKQRIADLKRELQEMLRIIENL